MGTWDVGPFSNDAAADLLSALDKAAPAAAVALLGETLASAAANDGYLAVDDGQAAVAAVAAQRLGGSRLDVSTVPPWLAEGGLDIPQELAGLALAALDRVLGRTLSCAVSGRIARGTTSSSRRSRRCGPCSPVVAEEQPGNTRPSITRPYQ
jgi:hypothetical protein